MRSRVQPARAWMREGHDRMHGMSSRDRSGNLCYYIILYVLYYMIIILLYYMYYMSIIVYEYYIITFCEYYII